MAVVLQALSAANCSNCIGGIVRSAMIDCAHMDWDAITVNANKQVTLLAVVLAGAGQFKEFKYDKDKTARFDSAGERAGSRHVNNQEAFMKWDCLSLDSLEAAEALKDACCLFAIHELADGTQVVQGGDVVPDGVGFKMVESLEPARAVVSAMSDTSANSSHLDVLVQAVSRNVMIPLADPDTFGLDDALSL